MKRGKFITFEGGEGGGKSTQSKLLVEALTARGIKVIWTREPGGTEGAEAIRQLLVTGDVNRWDAVTETLLHLAARRDHVVKRIEPALAEGTWVICDRFIDSTMAYQGYGHALGRVYIDMLTRLAIGSLMPDLTFILDINPEEGIERTVARAGVENRYEQMDTTFHQLLHQGFLAQAGHAPERCVVVNAAQPIEVLHQHIWDVVRERAGV